MAIETPSWFNNDTYLANKVIQLNSIKEGGRTDWNVAEVATAMGDMTPYEHFLQYGNKENISPNPDFNVAEYLKAKAEAMNAMNNGAGFQNQQWDEKTVLENITSHGLTVWDHYTRYGTEEGLNPSNAFDTSSYLEAKAAELNTRKFEGKTDWTVADVLHQFEINNLSALEHYFLYGKDEGLSIQPVPADEQVHTTFNPYAPNNGGTPGEEYDLTTTADNITGTANDDTFYAYQMPDVISDSRNTLQSGDRIDGGAGTDILYADLGATTELTGSHTITPVIKNVEVLKFRAQTTDDANDGTNNTVANPGVRIDAERIAAGDNGTIELWSQNSRADLTIEDVRIDSNKVTIGMQNTDAGDVDYFVYFDPQHLKSEASTTTGTLFLQLIDTVGALPKDQGGYNDPLYDNPYTGFKFSLNGKEYTVDFKGYNHNTDATPTYGELAALIQQTINDDPVLSKLGLTVTLGSSFPAIVGIGDHKGQEVSGTNIVITSSQGALTGDSWIAANGLPPTNSTSATFTQDSDTDCPLIQTNVDLDNVGRVQWEDASPNCLPNDIIFGSNAGDLMIGSMANRGGVERFDVKVDNGSWISSLFSTNQTLRMITVTAEDMDGDGKSGGQLYIGDWRGQGRDEHGNNEGNSNSVDNSMWVWTDAARLLSASPLGSNADADNPSGLNDVAVFDAKDYTGDINIGARISAISYTKYLKDLDTTATTTAPLEGYDGAFTYNTGSGNDVIDMGVNGGIAADKDFKMVINTGAGDDLVAFRYENMTVNQNLNQSKLQNVTINTGEGDDTVWFYANDEIAGVANTNDGTLKINTGAGNDTIYAGQIDHSWTEDSKITSADDYNAVMVFNVGGKNALDATKAVFVNGLSGAQSLNNDILGPQAGFSYGANVYTTDQDLMVTVQFKDLTVTAKVTDLGATNGYISATTINNAIINAIADDPVLSQLLVAKDGAGHSLIIESLINGVVAKEDLSINFNVVNAQGGTVGAFTQVNDAYDSQYAMVETGKNTNIYNPLSGHDTTDGHSIVNAGAGNDVIALGGGARDVVVLGENFGHDTLVGFETGVDQFNLYGMGVSGSQKVNDSNIAFSVSNGSISGTANSLSIVDNSTLSKAGDHSYDVSDFKKVYGTTAFDQGSRVVFMKNGSSTTGDHTYTVFKVESSASGTTGNNATVTKLGSINTADTSLAGLGTGDFVFVDPVNGNYNLVPNVFAGETFGPADYDPANKTTIDGTAWNDTFNGISDANLGAKITGGFLGQGGNDIFNIVGDFSQKIDGGADDDTFNIGGDINGAKLYGGTGNDTFNITAAVSGGTIDGGPEASTKLDDSSATDSLIIKGSASTDVTGLTVNSIENITITQAHNVAFTSMTTDEATTMTVTKANDVNVTLDASAATIINAAGADGVVTINGSSSTASLTLTAGKGVATLIGGHADDTLTSGAGGGEFTGGEGNDTIDLTLSAKANDTVVFSADNGTDTIKGFVGGSDAATADKLDLSGILGVTVTGFVSAEDGNAKDITLADGNVGILYNVKGGTLTADHVVTKDTTTTNGEVLLLAGDDGIVLVSDAANGTTDGTYNMYFVHQAKDASDTTTVELIGVLDSVNANEFAAGNFA